MKQPLSQSSKRTNGTLLHLTRALLLAGVLLPVFAVTVTRAAELLPSGSASRNDYFGYSVAISGETVYVGAPLDDDLGNSSGTVFVYHNISTAVGTVTESAKLYATGEVEEDQFGYAVSLSGTNALVTAAQDDFGRGAGWAIFDINAATPAQVRLAPPAPPFVGRRLGASASLSGNTALIGTNSDLSGMVGEAYVYRNIDTTPVQTQLVSSDLILNSSRYGEAVGLSGDIALVGAPTKTSDSGNTAGAVYMFQNLASATPTETKIVGFDTDPSDYFGGSISMSGNTALVGARSAGVLFGNDGGAAYVIRNLDATQVQTKLVASDRQLSDQFGVAVSLSGNTALVGANGDDGVDDLIPSAGAAYLFFNVDSGGANATVTEDLKIFSSNSFISAYGDKFGSSVAIDGDNFVVGAYSRNDGRGGAFTGSVSSMTTLDAGNATRSVDGISFISRSDWIIGQTTDGNTVQLTSGDTGNVTSADKAVFIGKNAGSDNNTLIVSGSLTANEIRIGAADNSGNKLQIGDGSTTGAVAGDIINHGSLTFNRSDSSLYGDQISGTGTVLKLGAGQLTLTDDSTYTGLTTIAGGSFLVEGDLSGTGLVDVTGGAIGGDGAIGGSLHFGLGTGIVFDPAKTLTINGATVTFDGFSMANIVGLDSTIALGTYALLNGPAAFDFTNVANFGLGDSYSLGDGKYAYFQSGSLDIVVVPEPSTVALLMWGGGAALLTLRRRKNIC